MLFVNVQFDTFCGVFCCCCVCVFSFYACPAMKLGEGGMLMDHLPVCPSVRVLSVSKLGSCGVRHHDPGWHAKKKKNRKKERI